MKTNGLLIVMMAMIFVAVIAAPAQAATQTITFADGSYAITSSKAGPIKATAQTPGMLRYSSGYGGTKSYSGNRDVWITTKVYSTLGTFMFYFRSKVNFSWRNKVVKAYRWYQPVLHVSSWTPGHVDMTYKFGPSWWFVWKGKNHGGRYMSITGKVEQSILKYGVIGSWVIQHQYKLYGNGRYWWKADS